MNLYLDNSNVIELRDLKNSATDAIDTGATVEVTIRDSSGNAVTGQTWPAAMSHVASGLYRATLDAAVALVAGRKYTAEIRATGSGGEDGAWNCQVIAQTRRCD